MKGEITTKVQKPCRPNSRSKKPRTREVEMTFPFEITEASADDAPVAFIVTGDRGHWNEEKRLKDEEMANRHPDEYRAYKDRLWRRAYSHFYS